MSSRKVYPITRTITVKSQSWLADVLTIETVAAHGLVATDVVTFMNQEFPEQFSGAITTVADTTHFTVACTNSKIRVPYQIQTNIFNATATGEQEAFTWGWGSYPSGAVQVVTNGTGTVTAKIQASLDGVNWVDAGSPASAALTAGQSAIFDITKPYIYGRLNFTVAVGGALGKVTAFRTVF